MKKLGNKFIIGVIFIITIIVVSQVFVAYSQSNRDTNSYLSLIIGNWTLNDTRLLPNDRKILTSGDKVRVIWESSIAVIQWWDGSMTRLWWNTTITIEQNEISRDYTNINISFELIAWKTWSNIVSFIWSDSSFTQTFDGIEAWVRWTVFDVDLEKQFIHTTDHSVLITTPLWETFLLPEWKVLNLESFSFIELSEYIKEFQDSAWIELNNSLDKEYLNTLKLDLESSLHSSNPFLFLLRFISPKYATFYVLDTYEDQRDIELYIAGLSDSKKQKIYSDVLSEYQEMNFVSANDEAYAKKMRYKEALVLLDVNDENTQRLVASSAYDLQDMLDSRNTAKIWNTLSFIEDNINQLDAQNLDIVKNWLDYIPEDLQNEFSESFNSLWDILNIDFSQIKNVNSNTLWDVLDSTDAAIQNFLDDNVWWLIEQFSN